MQEERSSLKEYIHQLMKDPSYTEAMRIQAEARQIKAMAHSYLEDGHRVAGTIPVDVIDLESIVELAALICVGAASVIEE